jgi:ribosomal-protein-alanine N-acetyltransferase
MMQRIFFRSMKTLNTKRLLLRRWARSDADDLYEYARLPEVGPAAGWLPHANHEESLELISYALMPSDYQWAIVLKENQRVIGSIGLSEDKKRTVANARALGYSLSSHYWNRGLMTEAALRVLEYAFMELHFEQLACYHYEDNIASRRVIEKCGFRFEGVLRRCSQLPNGVVHDDWCYSMTQEEYRKLRRFR